MIRSLSCNTDIVVLQAHCETKCLLYVHISSMFVDTTRFRPISASRSVWTELAYRKRSGTEDLVLLLRVSGWYFRSVLKISNWSALCTKWWTVWTPVWVPGHLQTCCTELVYSVGVIGQRASPCAASAVFSSVSFFISGAILNCRG